jgi:hypothetical protein
MNDSGVRKKNLKNSIFIFVLLNVKDQLDVGGVSISHVPSIL